MQKQDAARGLTDDPMRETNPAPGACREYSGAWPKFLQLQVFVYWITGPLRSNISMRLVFIPARVMKILNNMGRILSIGGNTMGDAKKNLIGWTGFAAILLITVITFIGFITFFETKDGKWSPEVVLSSLLILGVIVLIVALTFMAVIFKTLDLTDPTQTLGLPDGSVRAVIALSLIIIFMISSVFLYWQIQSHEMDREYYQFITKEQLADIPKEEIVSITQINETCFNATRQVNTGSKTANDIAKQVITTVSTLVVAVAGFYFGTRAVSVAKGAVATSDPLIRSIDPPNNNGERGVEKTFTIAGKNFESPKVRLVQDSKTIECSDITSSSTKIAGKMEKLKDPEKHPAGKWTVVVTNSDGGEDQFRDAFEITETPAGPAPANDKTQ